VGGGPEAAEAGELTLYAGGEAATLDRVEPILRVFAGQVHYTGPHGSGYLTKLLVNLFAGRHEVPAAMTSLVTGIHRDALARFGPVDGELLAIAHLEQA
jgi:3-hydroxyisobutyrate dehydrogenase-like beta-hydroxyacid dehydrogenase